MAHQTHTSVDYGLVLEVAVVLRTKCTFARRWPLRPGEFQRKLEALVEDRIQSLEFDRSLLRDDAIAFGFLIDIEDGEDAVYVALAVRVRCQQI